MSGNDLYEFILEFTGRIYRNAVRGPFLASFRYTIPERLETSMRVDCAGSRLAMIFDFDGTFCKMDIFRAGRFRCAG